jgi:predicted TIM-barrel fold metal-dependent hydrolase
MTGEIRWRQDWGAPSRETAAIDPDRALIDPHHHLWPDRAAGMVPARPYLARELVADVGSGHRVVATVAVEARAGYREDGPAELAPVGETKFLVDQAQVLSTLPGAPRLAGIVAYADLSVGARVAEVLVAHIEAGAGLMRGVRQMAAFDPAGLNFPFIPPGLYADARFREGVRELGEAGLTFDAWHFHIQQAEFVALAKACPQTTFVIDHYGTPLGVGAYAGMQEEVAATWREGVRQTAALPNVFVKLSGFAMHATGAPWIDAACQPTSDDIAARAAPWFAWLLEQFGPRRCMFASNFPVDKTGVSYLVLWNAYKKLAQGLARDEIDALCRGTAARVYRLQGVDE